MGLSTGRRISVAAALLSVVVLSGLIALTGCAPTVLSLGADTAYTVAELRTTDEGGVGSFVNDVAIEKSIQTKYLFNGGISSANHRVRSVNGTLYLIGLAKSQAELDEALEIARGTGNVKEIVNYMRIRTPPKS